MSSLSYICSWIILSISLVLTWEKGQGYWQTILIENFPITPFLLLPPSLLTHFLLVTPEEKFDVNITLLKHPNFQQFQIELICWITAPDSYLLVSNFSSDTRHLFLFIIYIPGFHCGVLKYIFTQGSKGIRQWPINWCISQWLSTLL